MPAAWAFLGGMVAVVHLGLFSYWINTYHAAAIAALGGALVCSGASAIDEDSSGSLRCAARIGIIILALTRPYEGLLLCLPVSFGARPLGVIRKESPCDASADSSRCLPVVAGCCSRRLAGLLRLPCVRKSVHAALHHQSRNVCDGALFCLAEAAPRAPIPAPGHAGSITTRLRSRSLQAALSLALSLANSLDGRGRNPVLCRHRPASTAVHAAPRLPGSAHSPSGFMHRVLTAGMAIQVFLLPHYLLRRSLRCLRTRSAGMRHLRVWRPGTKPAVSRWSGSRCPFAW